MPVDLRGRCTLQLLGSANTPRALLHEINIHRSLPSGAALAEECSAQASCDQSRRPSRAYWLSEVPSFAALQGSWIGSPSTELSAGTAAMPSLQELHTAAGVNKLPIEDFEDMSLVYPTVTKR